MTVLSQARRLATVLCAAAFSLMAVAPAARVQTLPGTMTSSWIGNSFMNVEGNQWVPDNVSDVCVTPDGTVFTAGYAEWGGAVFKNGKFVACYSGFDSGFGDPTAVVATEGENVYWGDGNGVYGYGYVRVLDKADGHYVGTIEPSVGGFSGGGARLTAFMR